MPTPINQNQPAPNVQTVQKSEVHETPFGSGPKVNVPMAGTSGSDAKKAILDLTKHDINITNAPTSLELNKAKKFNVVVPPGGLVTLRFKMTDPTNNKISYRKVVLRNEANARPRLASFAFDKTGMPMMRSETDNTGKIHQKDEQRLYKKVTEDKLFVMSSADAKHLSKIVGKPNPGAEIPEPLMERGREEDEKTKKMKTIDQVAQRAKKLETFASTPQSKAFNKELQLKRASIAPTRGKETTLDIDTSGVEVTAAPQQDPVPQQKRNNSASPQPAEPKTPDNKTASQSTNPNAVQLEVNVNTP